jgi:hypothetical protein
MIGDYWNDVSARRYDHTTGTGTSNKTVPANAWVTGYSFTAPAGSDATLVITPAGGAAKDTITVRQGEAYTNDLVLDRGYLAGAVFAFTGAADYIIHYALAV